MSLLPELDELMQSHDLDDVKISIDGDGYVWMYTVTSVVSPPFTIDGWACEGSEMIVKVVNKV